MPVHWFLHEKGMEICKKNKLVEPVERGWDEFCQRWWHHMWMWKIELPICTKLLWYQITFLKINAKWIDMWFWMWNQWSVKISDPTTWAHKTYLNSSVYIWQVFTYISEKCHYNTGIDWMLKVWSMVLGHSLYFL